MRQLHLLHNRLRMVRTWLHASQQPRRAIASHQPARRGGLLAAMSRSEADIAAALVAVRCEAGLDPA